jgi:hypothetical protein
VLAWYEVLGSISTMTKKRKEQQQESIKPNPVIPLGLEFF